MKVWILGVYISVDEENIGFKGNHIKMYASHARLGLMDFILMHCSNMDTYSLSIFNQTIQKTPLVYPLSTLVLHHFKLYSAQISPMWNE